MKNQYIVLLIVIIASVVAWYVIDERDKTVYNNGYQKGYTVGYAEMSRKYESNFHEVCINQTIANMTVNCTIVHNIDNQLIQMGY